MKKRADKKPPKARMGGDPFAVNAPPLNRVADSAWFSGKGSLIDHQPATRVAYFDLLAHCLRETVVTRAPAHEKRVRLESALEELAYAMRQAHSRGRRVVFIGNGGSAAIASHMAVDYSKNGGIRALALNDGAMLTCLANDFGYTAVFAKQVEYQCAKGDLAVIVSTSGRSPNIIAAADQAFAMGIEVVTFSGMNPNNLLRRKGRLNFYVPCAEYGLVELAHLSLLHSIVSVHK